MPSEGGINFRCHIWFVVVVSAVLFVSYLLTRPWFDPAFGIATIDMGNGKKMYLKRLDSGAVGPERLWLSEDPHRCSGYPDPTRDFIGNDYYNTLRYSAANGELTIFDYSAWRGPAKSSVVRFVTIYDDAAKQMIPHYLEIDTDPASLGISIAKVDQLSFCRNFPDGLFDGGWRDWFDPKVMRFIHRHEFSRQ